MNSRITFVVIAAVALSANLQQTTASEQKETGDEHQLLTVRDTAREPEVVIVRPYDWEPGMIASAETMQQIYALRGVGSCLYAKGRYVEAFPYLRAAARSGFKLAQARLAFLYQQGLGTERDPHAAIGWYGVAATGTTLPEIRNGYKRIMRRIPEEQRPAVAELVDEYKEKYGADRHRVECDLSVRAGTFLKKLTCRFRDEAIHIDHGPLFQALLEEQGGGTGLVNEVEAAGVLDNPFPTSTPLRAGSFGC